MKLISLEMENFRQYKGKQSIDFASSDKNVTVILGENGNGKTGIFRAINFCLFSQLNLEKDFEKKGAVVNIHLVNLNLLSENKEVPQSATVTLRFQVDGYLYTLRRATYDIMNKNGVVEANIEQEVELRCSKGYGEVQIIKDVTQINNIVDKIINKKVKDLFFFDGDKIEALSSTNELSREEIKNGVLRLLQIDDLDKAIDVTRQLVRDAKSKIKTDSNTSLQAKNDELNKSKDELVLKESLILKNQEEIDDLELEKKSLEIQQKNNEDLKALLEKIDNESKLLNNNNRLYRVTTLQLKEKIDKKLHTYLLQDLFDSSINNVSSIEKTKGYKSGLTIDLLDNILNNHKCICGEDVLDNSSHKKNLETLRIQYENLKLTDYLRDYKRYLLFNNKEAKTFESEVIPTIKELSEILNEMDSISAKIEDLDRSRKNYASELEFYDEMENRIRNINQELKIKNHSLIETKLERTTIQNKIEGLEKELDVLSIKDRQLHNARKHLDYAEKMYRAFEGIRSSYTEQMRKKLSTETTNIFKLLISSKDRNLLNKIEIDHNYELQAKSWSNVSIFKDISSGQKQMLSLSFVSALAKLASENNAENQITMPLFMDTPFGKLDGNNRDNLIQTMPLLCSQWILLVTDTEFTKNEVQMMLKTSKWNTMYQLNKIENGVTQIEPLQVNENIVEMDWVKR